MFSSFPVNAIHVGALTTVLESGDSFVSKAFGNQDKVAKFVNVSIIPVDNPKNMKPLQRGAPELLVSPATQVIGPNKTANVKLYYQGPVDGKERYYQLRFSEQDLPALTQLTNQTSLKTKRQITINTVLVVRPRQAEFTYEVNGKGKMSNTGNTFIRMLTSGQCSNSGSKQLETCSRYAFLLPGESVDFSKHFKKFDGYGVWRGSEYIHIPAQE